MRLFLSFFLLLSQTCFAQNTAAPTENIDAALVSAIIKGKTDTVEAIFKWVADNISYDVVRMNAISDKNGVAAQQEISTTLRTRKGVCDDYTYLLNALYKKAGYEAEKISGYTIDIHGVTEEKDGHAWTALKDKNTWYLLDATWAAGSVAGDVFTKEYDAKWYKMPPADFLKTHIPYDPIWRLTNPKRHQEIVDIIRKQDSVAILKSLMARMESCDDVQKNNRLHKATYLYIKQNLEAESHNNASDIIEKKLNGIVEQFHQQFGWYDFLDKKLSTKLTNDELKALQKEMNLTWNQANRLFLRLPDKPQKYISYHQDRVTKINLYLHKYFDSPKK